jgi:hypothetical protein
LFFLLSSCTCGVPLRVTSIQRSDKKLACKDIILEINEAEHYRDAAAQEQAIGMGEALMPICWVSGFVDGEQAIKKANARIEYLGHIYDLMDCGGKGKRKPLPKTPAPQRIIVPQKAPPPPPPKVPEPIKIPDPKPSHYRLMKNLGPNEMHEHMDKDGKLYIHSHKHSGPHRHLEDQN